MHISLIEGMFVHVGSPPLSDGDQSGYNKTIMLQKKFGAQALRTFGFSAQWLLLAADSTAAQTSHPA
jgi:hypothetical protein